MGFVVYYLDRYSLNKCLCSQDHLSFVNDNHEDISVCLQGSLTSVVWEASNSWCLQKWKGKPWNEWGWFSLSLRTCFYFLHGNRVVLTWRDQEVCRKISQASRCLTACQAEYQVLCGIWLSHSQLSSSGTDLAGCFLTSLLCLKIRPPQPVHSPKRVGVLHTIRVIFSRFCLLADWLSVL